MSQSFSGGGFDGLRKITSDLPKETHSSDCQHKPRKKEETKTSTATLKLGMKQT